MNDLFQNGVFWLPVGKECSDSKDGLLAKVSTVYLLYALFTSLLSKAFSMQTHA